LEVECDGGVGREEGGERRGADTGAAAEPAAGPGGARGAVGRRRGAARAPLHPQEPAAAAALRRAHLRTCHPRRPQQPPEPLQPPQQQVSTSFFCYFENSNLILHTEINENHFGTFSFKFKFYY